DEVGDGAGDEDFVGLGERLDPLGDVDGKATDVVTAQLDLAGVKPAAHADTDRPDTVADGAGAAHRSARPIKDSQEAVAGRLDFSAAETFEFGAGDAVVGGQQLRPSPVAHPGDLVGGAHHVGEHHGGQYAVELMVREPAGHEFFDGVQERSRVTDEEQDV